MELGAGGPAAALAVGSCLPSILSQPHQLGRRCHAQMRGLEDLVLGQGHAAVLQARIHGLDPPGEHEEQLAEGTAAIGLYPQQMETYHTLC